MQWLRSLSGRSICFYSEFDPYEVYMIGGLVLYKLILIKYRSNVSIYSWFDMLSSICHYVMKATADCRMMEWWRWSREVNQLRPLMLSADHDFKHHVKVNMEQSLRLFIFLRISRTSSNNKFLNRILDVYFHRRSHKIDGRWYLQIFCDDDMIS